MAFRYALTDLPTSRQVGRILMKWNGSYGVRLMGLEKWFYTRKQKQSNRKNELRLLCLVFGQNWGRGSGTRILLKDPLSSFRLKSHSQPWSFTVVAPFIHTRKISDFEVILNTFYNPFPSVGLKTISCNISIQRVRWDNQEWVFVNIIALWLVSKQKQKRLKDDGWRWPFRSLPNYFFFLFRSSYKTQLFECEHRVSIQIKAFCTVHSPLTTQAHEMLSSVNKKTVAIQF